jgi:hypothetical protein
MARKKPKRLAHAALPKIRTTRRAAGGPCNDPIGSYVKTVDIPYGQPQPRASCDPPTADEEGAAMDAAKDAFKAAANAYCGRGTCPNPSHRCVASVTIASIENQGVVETRVGEMKRCAIRFKITGSVSCSCPGDA